MPDDKPSDKFSLRKEFQSFSFGEPEEKPAASEPAKKAEQKPAPKPQAEPAKFDPKDLEALPFPEERDDDDEWEDEKERLNDQEHVFEAARGMLPRRKAVRNALEDLSNLDMDSVIAAGFIEEAFRGKLKDNEVDDLTVAALCLDAQNFDDMYQELSPGAVGIVDELRMADDEEDPARRMAMLQSFERDSARVFIAFATADMKMLQHFMAEDDIDAPEGPSAEEHEEFGAEIAAVAQGGDRSLVKRAVKAYNEISEALGYNPRLNLQADGKVELKPFPDLIIEKLPEPPKPKKPGTGPQA